MKILYVIHNISPDIPESKSTVLAGGCEKFTYSLGRGLCNEHDIYILYPDIRDKDKMYLHSIINFKNELVETIETKSRRGKMDAFARILDQYGIDLIHYQHLIHSPVEYSLIGKVKGIKQVLSLHDYYYVCEEHFLEGDKYVTCSLPTVIEECARCLQNKSQIAPRDTVKRRDVMTHVLKDMDVIVAPSKSVRTDYFKIYPEINEKLVMAPIGIEPPSPLPVIKQDGELIIGVYNYLTYIKGWVPMINTMRILETLNPKIKFYFFCDDMLGNQSKLLSGFSNTVHLPGEADKTPVHLAWIPSIAKESFSLLVSEALGRGTPILGCNKGALESRLSNDIAYLYDDYMGPRVLAHFINDIFKNEEERIEKAKKLLEDDNKPPTIDFSVSQYKRIYTKLLTE